MTGTSDDVDNISAVALEVFAGGGLHQRLSLIPEAAAEMQCSSPLYTVSDSLLLALARMQSSYRRFNAIVSQLKMHYFSEGAFESLIASQLLKKEKYI